MKITRHDGLALLGFICFFAGSISLILSLVGIHFVFLRFLENWGAGVSFAVKLSIMIVGLVIIYISRTPSLYQRDRSTEE